MIGSLANQTAEHRVSSSHHSAVAIGCAAFCARSGDVLRVVLEQPLAERIWSFEKCGVKTADAFLEQSREWERPSLAELSGDGGLLV